jgi:hypothetical protein
VEEVEEIRCSGPESLGLTRVQAPDRGEERVFGGAAQACIEETPEFELVLATLVDVGDAKLRLSEKRVVSAFEDLSLLGNRAHDRFERRPP